MATQHNMLGEKPPATRFGAFGRHIYIYLFTLNCGLTPIFIQFFIAGINMVDF